MKIDQTAPKEVAIRCIKVRGEMTQTALASLLGVQRNTVIRAESGNGYPSVKFINRLYEKLGILQTWLLAGEGPMRKGGGAGAPIAAQAKDITSELIPIADWLHSMVKKDGEGRMVWFLFTFEDRFPEYKKYIQKRETSETQGDNGESLHNVA